MIHRKVKIDKTPDTMATNITLMVHSRKHTRENYIPKSNERQDTRLGFSEKTKTTPLGSSFIL